MPQQSQAPLIGALKRGILFIIVALFLAACDATPPENAPPPPSPTPVPLEGEAVIYMVVPLSGAQAQQGQAQASGARLAAAILNEQGGLLGQRVVVKTINDRGNAQTAQEAAASIAASNENVVGVVVSESSDPQLQAVRDVYLGEMSPGPLVVVPASTNPLAETVNDPQFFRLSAPNLAQASEIANTLQENNLMDVMVIHSPTEDSISLVERFQESAANLDIAVTGTVEISPDETDFTETAASIFEQNPAALFLATNPYESGQILSALYAIDYQGGIYAVDQALPYAVVDELGCQAEGLYRASVVPSPRTVMAPGQQQRYASTEGRFAEPFSVAGYAAVEFIVQAYEGAGSTDAAAAAEYARSTPIATLLGDLNFDSSGHLAGATMHFQQVQARVFEDDFERVVGNPPQTSESTADPNQTYLERTFSPDKEPIIFADLNWNSALFHNAVARYIIEAGYEHPTQAVPGSTVPSFQRLVRGEVDIIIERYNFDDTVAEALATNQIVDLGVLFSEAVQGWFVPRYMVEGNTERGIEPITPELNNVEQLDQYANTFSRNSQTSTGAFYGGVPGWTAHKINCMKLKAYQLDDNYAQVTSGSTADLFSALADAYDNGDPILLYLWAPTSPLARYDLVQLEEPTYTDTCWATTRGCAYPTSDVRILVQGDVPQRAPEITQFLENFSMDIDAVSEVLVHIEDEELTPDEAAIIWLTENEATWSQWLPSEVAARVSEVLAAES